ncbi:MAG: hypothetical protein CVT67_01390 [Actinobacteria bacterium HGW-Actinobacteria-7]|jgi:thioredoxin-like negative regulator of GroEL|nr:MAG: hypothetical protein CVT67_01390 [Actinobacteria bacterium HGW-Actinobacteria-7]
MRPVVNGLQSEYAGKVEFVIYGAVNTDESSAKIADDHRVTTLPSMIIVATNGTEIARLDGAADASTLRTFIDKGLE